MGGEGLGNATHSKVTRAWIVGFGCILVCLRSCDGGARVNEVRGSWHGHPRGLGPPLFLLGQCTCLFFLCVLFGSVAAQRQRRVGWWPPKVDNAMSVVVVAVIVHAEGCAGWSAATRVQCSLAGHDRLDRLLDVCLLLAVEGVVTAQRRLEPHKVCGAVTCRLWGLEAVSLELRVVVVCCFAWWSSRLRAAGVEQSAR